MPSRQVRKYGKCWWKLIYGWKESATVALLDTFLQETFAPDFIKIQYGI
jgi:hypothetical protein